MSDSKDKKKEEETIIYDYQEMGKITATNLEDFFDENLLASYTATTTRD